MWDWVWDEVGIGVGDGWGGGGQGEVGGYMGGWVVEIPLIEVQDTRICSFARSFIVLIPY